MTRNPPRRLVTGHDANGKSVFLEDGPPPQFNAASNERVTYYELWNTEGAPTPISPVEAREPNDRPLQLPPPRQGTIIRIIDVHACNAKGMVKREDMSLIHLPQPTRLRRTAYDVFGLKKKYRIIS